MERNIKAPGQFGETHTEGFQHSDPVDIVDLEDRPLGVHAGESGLAGQWECGVPNELGMPFFANNDIIT